MKHLIYLLILFCTFNQLLYSQGLGAYYGWEILANAPSLTNNIKYTQTHNGDIFFMYHNGTKIYKLDINTGGQTEVFSHPNIIDQIYSSRFDNSNTLYYLQQGGSTSTYQLQASTDGGNTFSLVSNIADQFGGGIYKTKNGTIISFSPSRISFSTNGGSSFTNWTTDVEASVVTEGPDGKIYIGAKDGLYLANGVNQTLTKLNVAPECVSYVRVTNDGNIYFQHGNYNASNATCATFNAYNFGMSSDGGQTADFTNVFNATGPSNAPLQMIEGINNAKWLNNDFNYGLFFFHNYPNFTQVISGTNNDFRNIQFLAVEPSGRLIAISEGYIFASHYSIYQPQYFEEINSAETVSQLSRLQNGNLVAATDNATKLKTSSNNGASFDNEMLSLSSGNSIVDFIQMDNGKIIVAHTPGYIKTSDDDGLTWTNQALSTTTANISDIEAKGDLAVISRKGSVFYSTDGANTWNENYLYASTSSNPTLGKVLITQNNTVLIGQTYQNGGGYIYRSTDTAQNFNQLSQPVIKINDFAQADDGTIYAAAYEGLYISTDDGLTWTQDVTCPAIQAEVLCIRVNGDIELAGLDSVNHHYTYRKKAGETQWSFHITPLPYTLTSTAHFFDDPVTEKLYVNSLWRSIYPEPEPIINALSEKENQAIKTLNIYPNPSNDISYITTKNLNGMFNLQIIDVSGAVVYSATQEINEERIQLPHLHKCGFYYVVLQNEKEKWVEKCLKQ